MSKPTVGHHDRDVVKKAAYWHAILLSDDVSESEALECERWRRASEQNEAAFQNVKAVFSPINSLSSHSRNAASQALNDVLTHEKQADRTARRNALLLLPITVLVGYQLKLSYWDQFNSDHFSPKGSRKSIELVDGSTLILNTDSAVKIDFSTDQRRIVLQRGELWVDVAPDQNRPLIIETALGTAQALGTQYAVSLNRQRMDVVVTESRVKVCGLQPEIAAFSGSWCVNTDEGYRTRVAEGVVEGPEVVNDAALTAWLQGRLAVDDWPLTQVLNELKRYHSGLIVYNTDDIEGINVSGVFPIDEPDIVLNILAKNLPIKVNAFSEYFAYVQASEKP